MPLPSEKQQCMYWDKWPLAFGLKAKETGGRGGSVGQGESFLTRPFPVDYCQEECGPSRVQSSNV